jgi:multidrug efflux pump
MTLSDLSIKRPVLTIVFAIAIVIFGLVAFTSLGVREYPSVDPPIISVRTDYPGANSQIMETQITEPIEDYINRVDGVKNISSISSVGRSTVRVEFELGMDWIMLPMTLEIWFRKPLDLYRLMLSLLL